MSGCCVPGVERCGERTASVAGGIEARVDTFDHASHCASVAFVGRVLQRPASIEDDFKTYIVTSYHTSCSADVAGMDGLL